MQRELGKEYAVLFNAITRAEQELARIRAELMAAQQQAEELYICRTEAETQ